jgi:DNA-binding transcriptional MerR regulator
MSDPTDDGARLSVGQLAAAAGLTAKALRHYDRVGLFRPDAVDDQNGYRWYRAERLPEARLLAALRSVGVPLDEVARCLGHDRSALADDVLARHRQRLEARLARIQGDLHRLTHLQADGSPGTPVTQAPSGLADGGPPASRQPEVPDERQLAADLFNGVWTLLETEDRTLSQDDRMLHTAHASRYHWEQVGGPRHLARGEWLCSRVYAVLGRAEPALYHAGRALDLCEEHGIGDWDLAFAHEALARATAVAGDVEATRRHLADARSTPIADAADRELLENDLASIPGQLLPVGTRP